MYYTEAPPEVPQPVPYQLLVTTTSSAWATGAGVPVTGPFSTESGVTDIPGALRSEDGQFCLAVSDFTELSAGVNNRWRSGRRYGCPRLIVSFTRGADAFRGAVALDC